MGEDTIADPAKVRATPDQSGIPLIGDQREGNQDAAANKGEGVLDILGDLAASRQAIGTTSGTEG